MNITSTNTCTEIKTVLSESAKDEPHSPASTVILSGLSDVDPEGHTEDHEEFLQPLSKKVKRSFEQKLQKSHSELKTVQRVVQKQTEEMSNRKKNLAQLATEELNEVKEMWSR